MGLTAFFFLNISAAVSCQAVLVTMTHIYSVLREKEPQQTGEGPHRP